ncbi:circularly permuted type 2 ATP-grasp protein [Paracraurococcus lichenis]|uniref:Circularly permuted type 2 ATP-grasp protein n=1 Tax=Paracraurococcus lichenis TaxID=3064888 RepID=A0ABT9E0M7_9PROT|nr:circularly permuted type 2 ATP-grasp protein [Paracraurococcus sp. LOR1-02]MDO9709655.1 circularly permuted type 2 ATP-grasp protein [Paracraurococcus sp. LOR1-02]
MTSPAPLDEMVDGAGGIRPHWGNLLGALAGLGRGEIAERAAMLDRHVIEEGATSLLPGGADIPAWRCDPMPLVLAPAEFDALAAGLAQRAALLQAVLRDVYGPQTLLAEGLLPPALVYGNPAFLRSCRAPEGVRDGPLIQLYAADLLRGPDGQWRVLRDRTAGPTGLAHVLENRRALARYVPELVRARELRQHGPFFDLWQDSLQRLAPAGAAGRNPGVAMLTAGHSSPHWYEHVILSRRLSCALVEAGDLTVRDGALWLKTLRGLQPVDVLLRRMDGRQMDPLEADQSPWHGVAGLLDAMRGGAVRIVNDPGAGFAEAPALAAFLPALAERLLGERLRLASARTLWLGDPAARELVGPDLGPWLLRRAMDGTVRSVTAAALPEAERAELARRIRAAPEDYVACERLPASVAPCAGREGLEPRPVILRLFLLQDGSGWRALQGGLARSLAAAEAATGARPETALAKDVWVPADEATEIQGPPQLTIRALPIRRGTGDIPSRVADNFFWLGRYLERLESGARLLRATATRLAANDPSPRELAALKSLGACLVRTELLDPEAAQQIGSTPVTGALLRAVRERGRMQALLNHVSRLSGLLRDRLTGEMHIALHRGLRQLAEEFDAVPGGRDAGRGLEALGHASTAVLAFAATVAGLAAENMVRGGGRLFLDLGRRVERAQAIAAELNRCLDQPGAATQPARLEPGLALALELRDSVITYRSRYLTVLQAAPVLDLVLADEGNPRGLAFQLAAARDMLADLEGEPGAPLARLAEALLEDARMMVGEVAEAPSQAEAAIGLRPRLTAIEGGVAALSDRITRRWFALLPPAHSLGPAPAVRLRGAA